MTEAERRAQIEELKRLKRHLWLMLITLLISIYAITFAALGWFSNNKKMSSSDMNVVSENSAEIEILGDITAVRHYLADNFPDLIYNFKLDLDNNIRLVSIVDAEGDVKDINDEDYETVKLENLFEEMLPGEYVDLTIRTHMSDIMIGNDYGLVIDNISVGSKPTTPEEAELSTGWYFLNETDRPQIQHYYNILGIFKEKFISAVAYDGPDESTAATSPAISTANTDFVYFETYVANVDSDADPPGRMVVRGTWQECDHISLTFRVQCDFSPFYNLLKETGANISNLLSQKYFTIGKIALRRL